MRRRRGTRLLIPGLAFLVAALSVRSSPAQAQSRSQDPPDPAALEFFEKEVRPLLANRCQGCHGPTKQKGDLRLDSRAAILAGGSTGPAIVPGKPAESLLIDAINYGELYKMPPKSKLPANEIATLTKWVAQGAPWPVHTAAPASPRTPSVAFDLKQRASQWCFQPLRVGPLPVVSRPEWVRTPVDRFILAALEAHGLSPAPEADKRTLIRRLTFDLIGLPPTPEEIDAFLSDDTPGAYERLVERLLASPHYGERWARHWLDLVRFAETAGHEFDYDIQDAYRYRDYVVRAFNADLPYDQFVTEHLAGDLLENPRRHPTEGFNESILGTGFFLLGEGTHSPVDIREDQVRRFENQIDVFSKTFLGLTMACARCHDHKFDAISTRDYYALAGYLKSSRHQHAFIDPPDRIQAKAEALRGLKERIHALIADELPALVHAGTGWTGHDSSIVFEDFSGPSFEGWSVSGDAFGSGPTKGGEFVLRLDGSQAEVRPVAPGQAHSALVSERLQGVLRSRTFTIEKPYIHVLASGRKGRVNVVIDGFEKIRDPIYGGLSLEVNSGDYLRWVTHNVGMWLGHRAYLEIADGATVNHAGSVSSYFSGEGFITVDEIRFSDQGAPPVAADSAPPVLDLGRVNSRGAEPSLPALLEQYRELESRIPPPTLGLALADGTGEDERVNIRGSHLTLGEVVPRRFLEAVAGSDQPAPRSGSGRLELARRVIAPSNPLPARVMANRIWKHHFGEGIVKTPDDFGVMGQPPTHPELLDDLADRFIRGGWSIKALHRLIVLSSTYRMASRPDPASERADPTNRWLHRMNVRRLEAEAIRDAILAVSGRLDRTQFDPSVPIHLTTLMDGRGRPSQSGPLDGNGRRSLYLNVRRNFLNPMFLAFDAPAPFSTMGRRNVSNVPAQALTLLNDPFVVTQARHWAERLSAGPEHDPRRRIERLYLTAYARPTSSREVQEGLEFLEEQSRAYGRDDDPRAWADYCHVLMNVKEFIYIN